MLLCYDRMFRQFVLLILLYAVKNTFSALADPGCNRGYYGEMCRQTCFGCFMWECDAMTGACKQGCSAGVSGMLCDAPCPEGTYGLKCSKNCSNCLHTDCNPVSGICVKGCKAGFLGKTCNSVCSKGTHGMNCSKTCTYCVDNSCNPVTGYCTGGCYKYMRNLCGQDGSQGLKPQPVPTITSKTQPRSTTLAATNSTLQPTTAATNFTVQHTAAATSSTVPHEATTNTNSTLEPRNSTLQTLAATSPNITTSSLDNNLTSASWTMRECPIGRYGPNCSRRCRKCINNVCDSYSGHCLHGCSSGYQGPLCDQAEADQGNNPCDLDTSGVYCNRLNDSSVSDNFSYNNSDENDTSLTLLEVQEFLEPPSSSMLIDVVFMIITMVVFLSVLSYVSWPNKTALPTSTDDENDVNWEAQQGGMDESMYFEDYHDEGLFNIAEESFSMSALAILRSLTISEQSLELQSQQEADDYTYSDDIADDSPTTRKQRHRQI